MSSAVANVVIAAVQSVAKVFVIGSIGYLAVQYPQKAPLLPTKAVSIIARFSFNVLTISLIFSTISTAVTIGTLGEYWFIVAGAFGVFAISFVTATLLAYVIPIPNQRDFIALRLSVTFPNIVALPILIFPSLCEYSVVYEAFGEGDDRASMQQQCEARSNTMIFCYFFSWSLLFWSIGHPSLMKAARMQSPKEEEEEERISSVSSTTAHIRSNGSENQSIDLAVQNTEQENPSLSSSNSEGDKQNPIIAVFTNFWVAIKRTFASPPFIAMLAASVIGCVPPLRNLLFSQGGTLRFLGAAVETLGKASSPMSTMVVAASLVPQKQDDRESAREHSGDEEQARVQYDVSDNHEQNVSLSEEDEPRFMSDPNFGPHDLRRRSSIRRIGNAIKRNSILALNKVKRTPPEQRRVLLWFSLSRLVLAPLFVVLTIVGLDCGAGVLGGVPDLAKLVLIVNASVPGALIIVVVLKSNPELYETAAVVARVYLPTYIFSIASIAGWTALGLVVSIRDENGNSFCSRF